MFKSLFAAIAIFFASIFGGHQVAAPSQPAAAVVAVVSNETPSAISTPGAAGSQSSPAIATTTIVNQYITQPVIEHTIQTNTSQSLTQLQAEIAGLQVQINQLLSAQHPSYLSGAPAVITFPGNTIPPADALPSTATVGGLPIATTQDVSQLSQWTTSGSDIYFNTGNVGIGTNSPGSPLSVVGSTTITGHMAIGNIASIDSINGGVPGSGTGLDPAALRTQNDVVGNLGQYDYALGIGDLSNYTVTDSGAVIIGVQGDPYITTNSTGEIANVTGLDANPANFGSGFIDRLFGGDFGINNSGSGTINNGYGIEIQTPGNTGPGGFNNNIGLYIQDQSGIGTTSSLNLYSEGANSINYFQGKVAIGTSTPWRTMSVTGTVGFDGLTGATGAGSLCLSANKEVVYNSGSDNCLSSLRSTKHDINNLEVSGTTTVWELKPVSFVYNDDASSTVRYGFIAEDTAAVDSHFGTYDQSGKLSGVDDRSLLSVVVKALQELIATVQGFAQKFTTKEADVGKLCVQKSDGTLVCITGDQLASVLSGQPSVQISGPTPPTISGTSTPPSISIAGNNPAYVTVGASYQDLGAIATDNQGHTLGYKTFLNGTLVSNIVIDTSAPATDTIDYVATDNAGNTATSTRSVIIEAASSTPPTSPPTDATTSAATSTSQ